MPATERGTTDWRDAAAYAPLLQADRSIFAWEWLRRDPAYRAAARRAMPDEALPGRGSGGPERWGLHGFVDPDLSAPDSRPIWTADRHPSVLAAVAGAPGKAEDAFDLTRFAHVATIASNARDQEHLLLSDGLRAVRIDVLAGSVVRGPVQLRYLLGGFESAEKPLLTLRRLLALRRTGRFSRQLHAPEPRARRWILMLRTSDALAEGADQREIAAVLLGSAAGEPRWRTHSPSLRSQAQRVVRGARQMAAGNYLHLLL